MDIDLDMDVNMDLDIKDNDNYVVTTSSTNAAIIHHGSSVKMGVLWNESSVLLLLW